MHVVEEEQFDSIPIATYWAIVTMTHTGYGDLSPNTSSGRVVASVVMGLSYTVVVIGLRDQISNHQNKRGYVLPLRRTSTSEVYSGLPINATPPTSPHKVDDTTSG